MKTLTAAIASHLNVSESAIMRIEEWANVMFVTAKGIGARFVSKKIKEKKMERLNGYKLRPVDAGAKEIHLVGSYNRALLGVIDGKLQTIGLVKPQQGVVYYSKSHERNRFDFVLGDNNPQSVFNAFVSRDLDAIWECAKKSGMEDEEDILEIEADGEAHQEANLWLQIWDRSIRSHQAKKVIG